MAGDFKIGTGYVEVHLKDATDKDLGQLKRKLAGTEATVKAKLDPRSAQADMKRLSESLKRKGTTLPIGAKIQDVGPELQRLRKQIRDVKLEAKPKVVWEEREFTNAYGQTYKRFVKVSKDSGTFASEALGASMYKGVATLMRQPGLFGPVLAAAGAFGSSAALLAIPAKFAQIGAQIQGTNAEVAQSFTGLKKDVTSALQADTAPMAGALISNTQRIGTAFQTLRPQIRDIFAQIPSQLDTLTGGVTRFATNAMPGLVTAVKSADPVVSGLADGMASAGVGVTRFYTAASVGAPGAGQGLRSLGVIASDVGEMLGRVSGSMGQTFGPVLQNAEGTFKRLTATVGNFATSALPPLGAGLDAAIGAFGGALAIIQPFSGIIGTVAGTVLGATVAVRGLSAAFGILASSRVLTMFTPLKSAFLTLTTQVGTAGASFATWTTKATGSVAAGEKVAGAANKVVGAMRAAGSAIPIAGAALIGLGIAYSEVASKAGEAASQVNSGSMTMQEAINTERNQIEKLTLAHAPWLTSAKEAHKVSLADAQARKNVAAAMQEQEKSMGAVEAAQSRASRAQAEYDAAVAAGNPQAAAAAAGEVAAANEALAAAQFAAERATRSHTQALVDQTNIMQGSVDAEFAYADAVKATEEAQKAAASGGAEAVDALARAMNDQAQAASKAAEAAYAGVDPQLQASKAAEAYRTELLRTASATGPAGSAFASVATKMNDVELAALSATAEASGLRTELVTLPDGRQVRIVTEVDRSQLDQLNNDFRGLDNRSILMGLDINTATAEQKAAAYVAGVEGLVAMAKIDADASPGTQKADALKQHIDAITAIMTADADISPGTAKGDELQAHIDGLTAIMTADADSKPGTAKGDALKAYIDKLQAAIKANLNDAEAKAALARLTQARTMTITAIVRQRALPPGHTASGGAVTGFAGGGLAKASRSRGMIVPGYAPGVDDVPAVLSRGEAVLVPELTRALGAGRILAANREASGGRAASVVGSMAGMMDGTIGRRFSGGGLVKAGAARFAGGGIQGSTSSYMMDEWMAATYKAAKLDPGSDKGKVAAAQKQIIDALRTEKEAWIQLTQARKDAARALEDMREKVSDYAIDAEGADIAVQRSYLRLQEMLKDRGATALDKREAQNAYDSAFERQKDMAEEHARDVAALRAAEAAGVEGADGVIDAKDRVVIGHNGVVASKVNLTTTNAEIKKAKADKKKADAEAKKAKSKSKSFDSGGIASGIGMLPKLTTRPERVLSPDQTAAFERLVAVMERHGRPTSPARSVGDVHLHMEQRSGGPAETARLVSLALRGIG